MKQVVSWNKESPSAYAVGSVNATMFAYYSCLSTQVNRSRSVGLMRKIFKRSLLTITFSQKQGQGNFDLDHGDNVMKDIWYW